MATATNLRLFGQRDRKISFASLCNEVRTNIHECGDFETALSVAFKNHDVATALTREVLSCELRSEIKKERRRSSIPRSKKNMTEYVRVLLHYDIAFTDAMEKACAQYNVRAYSEASHELYREISRELNRRALEVQARNRNNFESPAG